MDARHLPLSGLTALVLGILVLAACTVGAASTSGPPALPTSSPLPAQVDSPEDLLQQRCRDCHSLQRITSASKTQAEWEKSVRRMVALGVELGDAEFVLLVEYLAANYK